MGPMGPKYLASLQTIAIMKPTLILCFFLAAAPLQAQTNWGRVLSGIAKVGKAMTITDEELAEAVKEEIALMDSKNKVCASNSKYSRRLKRLVKGMTEADGIALNFKVYMTTDVNAFACPDGSVRVYSALMDALSDNELLGVIGHEIGHVALRHSKKAWRNALLRSAASDAIASRSSSWATLSDSFIGDISSVALSASNSRYQETQADEYGYTFLKRCGKDPMAMVCMLEKLKALSEDHTEGYARWLQAFSSHPDFDERIAHLEKLHQQ